jgi:hypothetical protein
MPLLAMVLVPATTLACVPDACMVEKFTPPLMPIAGSCAKAANDEQDKSKAKKVFFM